MELFTGRPATNEGRLDKEIRVYDFLDKLGIAYQRVDHEPAETMEVCAEIDKVLQATICKNLFLCNRQKTQFYLLMMPGDKPFKTKRNNIADRQRKIVVCRACGYGEIFRYFAGRSQRHGIDE